MALVVSGDLLSLQIHSWQPGSSCLLLPWWRQMAGFHPSPHRPHWSSRRWEPGCWRRWGHLVDTAHDSELQVNSLAPGRFERNLRKVIFKLILMIVGWGIFYKMALRWMSMDLTDDKSTLVQVMAWCRQATSHYLSQCWPRSMPPYGVTWPQWVKSLVPGRSGCHIKICIFQSCSN